MSGRTLATALVAIACLTFVLPPLAARQAHARRIARAQQDVQRILKALVANRGAVLDAIRKTVGEQPAVLAGPGATPKFVDGTEWPEARTLAPAAAVAGVSSSVITSPDPWGNQYLVAVSGGSDGCVVVLSAGPNGIVETRLASASKPGGDDIGTGR